MKLLNITNKNRRDGRIQIAAGFDENGLAVEKYHIDSRKLLKNNQTGRDNQSLYIAFWIKYVFNASFVLLCFFYGFLESKKYSPYDCDLKNRPNLFYLNQNEFNLNTFFGFATQKLQRIGSFSDFTVSNIIVRTFRH